MAIEPIESLTKESIRNKQMKYGLALNFSEIRRQLFRIQAEGDKNSSFIAKRIEGLLDQCVELISW